MLTTLASLNDPNIFDSVSSIFGRVDALNHPESLVEVLAQMSIVWGVVFLIAGLVCLLNGYKMYRWVTVVLAACVGGVAGYCLGQRINAEFIVAGCLGALLAVTAYPLMKYAVAAMGGLVGAFLGANLWGAMAGVVEPAMQKTIASTYWVGALMGLLLCGMLAFILFKLSVVLFTSVSGATIAMIGVLALVLQVPAWRSSIDSWSSHANAMVFPLLVLVPAVIGLILQQVKPEAASGGGGKPAAKAA
ncbi:MAG: hypothetical protein WD042_17215 [Phycisphaeraceae bacterium]